MVRRADEQTHRVLRERLCRTAAEQQRRVRHGLREPRLTDRRLRLRDKWSQRLLDALAQERLCDSVRRLEGVDGVEVVRYGSEVRVDFLGE